MQKHTMIFIYGLKINTPTGWHIIAQSNALGYRRHHPLKPWKGETSQGKVLWHCHYPKLFFTSFSVQEQNKSHSWKYHPLIWKPTTSFVAMMSMFRPFRAKTYCVPIFPGRCPGLVCFTPSGCKYSNFSIHFPPFGWKLIFWKTMIIIPQPSLTCYCFIVLVRRERNRTSRPRRFAPRYCVVIAFYGCHSGFRRNDRKCENLVGARGIEPRAFVASLPRGG